MIKVWTDATEAGLLDRHGERGSTFAYLPGAPPKREVSVTMPLRLESWSVPFGLLPVFEMNLPEGVLRERLRLAFAKATGTFDEFDLLSIVGRSQVGRTRYTGDREQLHEDVPFQSVDEILERKRGGDLFRYLLEKFASFSGISGVQPKILVRDEKDRPQPRMDRDAGGGMSVTVGRLFPDNVLDYRFVVLGHNTIRGAAGAAILNGELLQARGLLAGKTAQEKTATSAEVRVR